MSTLAIEPTRVSYQAALAGIIPPEGAVVEVYYDGWIADAQVVIVSHEGNPLDAAAYVFTLVLDDGVEVEWDHDTLLGYMGDV